MSKKKALGRGLNALITMDDNETKGSSYISEIALDKIKPNPDQPRVDFDDEAMEELSISIQKIGVIQPITLRELEDGGFQIIAGERRYRASLMANLKTIPAYVKTVEDEDVMEMALVENIQREDLNAIEIALTYQKLIDSQSLTQEQLSDRVGKKRATVANYMRLLKLPAVVQMGIKDKKIDMGHARALVAIDDPEVQLEIYNQIIKEGLSVRRVEAVVKEKVAERLKDNESTPPKTRQKSSDEFDVLRNHLSRFFDAPVEFNYNKKGKGKITIPFKSNEDLERIIGIFDVIKK
ncbi:MAG TPA: ParB/RepB/Spo0J family partition protein [Dysgonamonadaceae bacterium]|jgi:ParB family chromosome partitioning protein|nr:ParB/RepB/Spo0J family partition protein [Dysgonamonadaceae bacterium]